MSQSNDVTDLMYDHVSRDIWHVKWRKFQSSNANNAFTVLIERTCKRNKFGIGQKDVQVACEVAEGFRVFNRAARADDGEAQCLKVGFRNYSFYA